MRKFLAIVLGASLFAFCQAQILGPIFARNHVSSVTWGIGTGPVLSAVCTSTSATCSSASSVTASAGNVIVFGILNAVNASISAFNQGSPYCNGCTNSLTTCFLQDASSGFTSDCGYAILATGITSQTLTVTRSNTTSGGWRFWYVVITRTPSGATIDQVGTRDQTTNTTAPAGVTLSGCGSNDVIVQSISANTSAVNSPWSGNVTSFAASGAAAVALGVGCSTIPTWTTTSNKAALSAIAFK